MNRRKMNRVSGALLLVGLGSALVVFLTAAPEADDPLLLQEIALVGEQHILFSSDYPHGEGRDNAASEILERKDLSESQKRRILYDNTVRFCGEP
jgi:predicted TIM-barrel fold metal-dependent hydrolase